MAAKIAVLSLGGEFARDGIGTFIDLCKLTHRHREQAQLPQGLAVTARLCSPHRSHRIISAASQSQAKKSPISLKRSIGLMHSGAISAKGGSMRKTVWREAPGH